MNARPSPIEIMCGGWIIRAAGGPARRLNCVNPTGNRPLDIPLILDEAERLYDALERPSIFRVPSMMAAELDECLDRRGYRVEMETSVQLAEIAKISVSPHPDTEVSATPSEDWLAAWSYMGGAVSPVAEDIFRRSIGSLMLPRAFACHRLDGVPVAIAYAVLYRGLMVGDALATHPDYRNRGYARHVADALLSWGGARGAATACLVVRADNDRALSFHRALGFDREIYRYHFRVR